ncbi:MAG: 2OG-Fe(II) oxygenase family protein [Deltaproteobacteria bacterium]|nr:2OG-Fe(II) oxygenase family protein [Deltaproteobacteria bacterium]
MTSPFESGGLAQLFATPVFTFALRSPADLLARVEARLREVRAGDRRPGALSRPGLWQSPGDLHRDPAFAEVHAAVQAGAEACLKLLALDCTLAVSELWGNISSARDALHEHTHPNNYLSGILYVRMPEGAGATIFQDPRPQARVLRPTVVRDNPLNSTEFALNGRAGTLVLFPAWLTHEVRPSETDAERITVAFNLMVRGRLGSPGLLASSEV